MAEDERERQEYVRRSSRGGLMIGLVLISIGVTLLIANIYPGFDFGDLWPATIIAWGLAVVVSSLIPRFDVSRLFSGILIGVIGTILLYNTLGVIPFGFWIDLLALWPILLITLGFSILGGATKSKLVASLPSIIIIATLTLGLFYSNAIFQSRGLTDFMFSWENVAGTKNGSAEIKFAVGELSIAGTGKLYDIEATEPAGSGKPRVSYTASGDSARLKVEPRNALTLFRGEQSRRWKVMLSRDVNWRLEVDAGVSNAKLDLSDLIVEELDLEGGVGDLTVRFGDKADRANISISGGVSKFKLLVPKSTGVRLNLDTGPVNKRFRGIDLRSVGGKDRGVYETPGFDSAQKKLAISINAGISRVIVEGY